ncbi:MAG TPA: hypothetical protein VKH42_17040 [Vicinamibacterales bacterium]|nr:hypothetical protein [Vicinamibacterales bacterium]
MDVRKPIALVTAYSLLLSSSMTIAGAQTAAPKTTPPATKAPAPAKTSTPPRTAAATPDIDGGWPRAYGTSSGSLFLLYTPQVASWKDQKHMVLYVAVSYTAKGQKPALGTITIETDTKVALDQRLVSISEFQITEAHFSTLTADQVRTVTEEIKANVPPTTDRVLALDRVLAAVDKSQIVPKNIDGLKGDPPVIFYSTTPAVVVNIDGEPIWSPIKDNDLKFAVNTNWDLFQYGPTNTLYLRDEKHWLEATAVKGPWKPAVKLPDSVSKLPPDENWKDVKAALPPATYAAGKVPKVFASTMPAELILVTGGPPSYLLVDKTKLLWVSNTESDVFRLGKDGTVYYLVSGRWFSAPGFDGPWTFATPTLPEDFKKISLEHPRSRVLASVPGTAQAAEAVMLAQVPQTARVNKKELKAPEVEFQGPPEFQPIEKTTVSRAVNTDKDIIRNGDLYYMCFQGVWFVSKSPSGPWEVTGSVPATLYEIPPSSPSYNVTHVTVVEDDSDEVEFATAMAFTGMMVAWGCVVWGSGYYYPPYVGYGGFYPGYYPFYPTYGFRATYNPWTGAYGRSAFAYGPYGGAGVGARYNPRTGTYARGAAAWGPYGARGAASAYNPRTGAVGATRQGSNVYGSWGQSAVRRGDQWATTSRATNNVTGATTRRTTTSGGGTAVTRNGPGAGNNSGAVRTGSGDVYAGRDGNVYRNTGGGWQQYDNGGWNSVNTPTPSQRDAGQTRGTQQGTGAASNPTVGQLNQDSAARADGAQRTRDAGASRSPSTGFNSGSYRPSGGAGGGARAGGGGGRRR